MRPMPQITDLAKGELLDRPAPADRSSVEQEGFTDPKFTPTQEGVSRLDDPPPAEA